MPMSNKLFDTLSVLVHKSEIQVTEVPPAIVNLAEIAVNASRVKAWEDTSDKPERFPTRIGKLGLRGVGRRPNL